MMRIKKEEEDKLKEKNFNSDFEKDKFKRELIIDYFKDEIIEAIKKSGYYELVKM